MLSTTLGDPELSSAVVAAGWAGLVLQLASGLFACRLAAEEMQLGLFN